ncbi:hypothetical protein TNCV_1375091 [Trichonephila clavipes]|nr:hypothetical protein TNCV_1375091 [Trichonephila clavipes]
MSSVSSLSPTHLGDRERGASLSKVIEEEEECSKEPSSPDEGLELQIDPSGNNHYLVEKASREDSFITPDAKITAAVSVYEKTPESYGDVDIEDTLQTPKISYSERTTLRNFEQDATAMVLLFLRRFCNNTAEC